jgi:hypothetical protein
VDEHETRPSEARVRKLGQYAGVVPEASDAGSKKEAAPFLVPESNLPSSPQARQEKRAGETRAAGSEAAPEPGSTASSSGGAMPTGSRAEAAPARTPGEQAAEQGMAVDPEDQEMQAPDAVPREPAQRPVNQKVARLYEAALDAFKAPMKRVHLCRLQRMTARERICMVRLNL